MIDNDIIKSMLNRLRANLESFDVEANKKTDTYVIVQIYSIYGNINPIAGKKFNLTYENDTNILDLKYKGPSNVINVMDDQHLTIDMTSIYSFNLLMTTINITGTNGRLTAIK